MTLDCVDSLLATEWPADRLEVLVVDNGSVDGIAERLKADYPRVRVLEPFANLGFAAGCNLGIRATGDYDHVALINNDTVVTPGWLAPMVERLRLGAPEGPGSSGRVGAVAAKMVFYDRFYDIGFEVPGADRPFKKEPRRLGARVTAVHLDGVPVDRDRLGSDEGFHAPEAPFANEGEEVAYWSGARGSLRIRAVEGEHPTTVRLRLRAAKRQPARITSAGVTLDVVLDTQPRWFELPLEPEPLDIIQNVGSGLFNGTYGGDLGFHEPDRGQYDEPTEVFAWCGGAVLFDRAYLDEVGLFDDRFFLYYEDTDLSWRGRLAGWTYWYEPRAVVRHKHAQSSGLGSATFRYYVDRNRLLMLLKNAPAPVATRAVAVVLRDLFNHVKGSAIRPLFRLRRPDLVEIKHRVKVLRGMYPLVPFMLADRRRQHPVVPREQMMGWNQKKVTV